MNLEELLINSAKRFNVDIDRDMSKKFMMYKDLILDWNNRVNLTAIVDEREIILKHFIDSISIIENFDNDAKSIVDIGTGAGFPGIPIKIVKPDYDITLLDSLNKRVKFLDAVTEDLGLTKIQSIHTRAEDAARDDFLREEFDIATSRAVANMSILCEYALPFVKVGGEFLAFKGPEVEEEIKSANKAIKELGGELKDIKYINIPETDIKHSIIIVSKIRQTPAKYPRNSNKIKSNPIIS